MERMKIYPIEPQPVSRDRRLEVAVVLLEVWEKHPHLRASQLISNALYFYFQQHGLQFSGEIYYVENQMLIDALKAYPHGATGSAASS